MMKTLLLTFLTGILITATINVQYAHSEERKLSFDLKEKELKLKITGLTCAGCASHLHQILSDIDGVTDNSVEYPGDIAVIKYDPEKTSAEQIIGVIEEKSNYKAKVYTAPSE